MAANQCEDLIPPEGCAWRGATHWNTDASDDFNIFEFQLEFGVPLHIFRSFKYPTKEHITPEEQKFVEGGGILWYGFGQQAWDKEIKNLKKYADAIKSLAPAKVMVCPGWEPDGHAEELGAKGKELFGTCAQHRAFRDNVKKSFDEMGVDNAVYIIDFSAKPAFALDMLGGLKDLYPEDGHITWTFFNAFGVVSKAAYERQVAAKKAQLSAHYSSKEQIKVFVDHFEKNEGPWTGKPWGLGAWGTNCIDRSPQKLPIPVEDRMLFLDEVGELFEKGTHPNLKAQVYFDSLYCIITPEDVEIEQKGDLAHNFEVTKFPTSPELVPNFKAMMSAKPFMEADRQFGQSIMNAAADFISGLPGALLGGVASIGGILVSPFVSSNEKVKKVLEGNVPECS